MKKLLTSMLIGISVLCHANQVDTWSSPPDTISASGVTGSNPCVGIDNSGNIVAVWLENGVVISKSKLLNGSWSSAQTLSGSGALTPQLAVDINGNATAIWEESGAIKTSTQPFGGSWGSATTLAASGSSSPQIAVDSNGDLVAVWVASGVINSSTKLLNQSWSATPDVLSGSGADSPQVAIGSNGDVFAVWHAQNNVSLIDTIYTASKTISNSWSAAATISTPSQNSVYPQITVDSNGNATAIWFQYNVSGSAYNNVGVQAAYYSSSTSLWSSPTLISDLGLKNPANLQSKVTYSLTGFPLAMWTNSYDGSSFQLESAQADNLNNWSSSLSLESNLYDYTFDFNAISSNCVIAVYMTYDSGSSSFVIKTTETEIGGVGSGYWNPAEIISSSTPNGFPKVAASVNGPIDINASAIWIGFNGSNNVIEAVTGTGTLVYPPSNITVSQSMNNFDIFNEYYNTISWTASTDPNLSGYVIYRNNELISVLDSSYSQYVDHNQEQNGSVTYGVSAIDSSYSESVIVFQTFP